jgi:pyruvate dehydrogenase E2 component (dihydrolipoamide acetyltransferase)
MGEDPDFAKVKRVMNRLPRLPLRWALRASVWLAGERATSVPSLGIRQTPFGSAMVSSVGMFGLPNGFTPLAWIYTVPVIVLLGEIVERPVAVSGRVEVRPVLPVTATIDHRYVDGAELGLALKAFREYLENPAAFEDGRSGPAPRGSAVDS